MKPFSAPLDDILFSLNHVAGATSLSTWDAALAADIGGHFAAFAEAELAPLNAPGDHQGCRLVDGRVVMPDGFAAAYTSFAEQGWPGLTAPECFGGQGLATPVQAIASEIFAGANHSLQMVTGLVPGAIRTLIRFGTEQQQQRYIPSLASGDTLATMCLTEAEAGSDLSRIRCKAKRTENGWTITGEKIFISGGDQDMSARILHLVLARTSHEGVKGLSLFLCPCTRPDGSRIAIAVTRIEEKMGLHASPTCQLAFDGAGAELIGDLGAGLPAMFTMMNHARIDVALQGVAHAARAHDIARSHAAERMQGRSHGGEPVPLDHHADVRRMLDLIDSLALGSRAVAHLALVAVEADGQSDLAEFLTPIAKVYCTQAGIRAADLGMQVLGGYGYLAEYGLEQVYRDVRVTSIYEGANGIHERALVTRLLPGAAAAAFDRFIADEGATGHVDQAATIDLHLRWRSARNTLLSAKDPTDRAHDFFNLTSDLLLRCLWSRMASNAHAHMDPDRIHRLAGKMLRPASLASTLRRFSMPTTSRNN